MFMVPFDKWFDRVYSHTYRGETKFNLNIRCFKLIYCLKVVTRSVVKLPGTTAGGVAPVRFGLAHSRRPARRGCRASSWSTRRTALETYSKWRITQKPLIAIAPSMKSSKGEEPEAFKSHISNKSLPLYKKFWWSSFSAEKIVIFFLFSWKSSLYIFRGCAGRAVRGQPLPMRNFFQPISRCQ